jgi:thioesterase domain-containing protein
MAALYVKEIRSVQPHGPYLLGGYCLGGSIAYEAAQQFHAAGEKVALLALFDTMNWHKVQLNGWTKISRAIQRMFFHTSALIDLDTDGRRKFLNEKFGELRNRIPVWRGMLLAKFGKRGSLGESSGAQVLGQVWRANHQASRHYIPRAYPGAVTDFRPSRQYGVLSEPGLKWDGLAEGGQRVVIVSAYPAVMLIEPYVHELAEMLMGCIEDAVRGGGYSKPEAVPALAERDVSIH